MNAFIACTIYGLLGAISAMISSYLPCIIIVTLVAKYYYSYKASLIVNSSFKAIIPAVIGLLSAVSIFLGKASLVNISTFGITMASFSLIAFTKIDPTSVTIGARIAGALLY